jgi:hypothetical protein
MAPANLQPTTHTKVNLGNPQELAFWSSYFAASEAELNAAIAAVGNYLMVLEDYFGARMQARA